MCEQTGWSVFLEQTQARHKTRSTRTAGTCFVASLRTLRDRWRCRHPCGLWYLHWSSRLSGAAREFMDAAARAGHSIALSAVSLAEIVYLVEKNRLPESAYQTWASEYVFEEAPVTADVVAAMRRVSRDAVPDLPDRSVAATAVHFTAPIGGRFRAGRRISSLSKIA